MKGYLWAMASVMLVSTAQLLLKWSVVQLPALDSNTAWLEWLNGSGMVQGVLVLGGLCYGVSMGCWFMALRKLPLSRAYPLLSLSYVMVYFAAIGLPWFNETASIWKLIGVVLILFGIWFIYLPTLRRDVN